MRLTISGTESDVEVIAEPVTIDGTGELFAVHPSLEALSGLPYADECWTVTHVDSHMALARGATIDAAVAEARAKWASKTSVELATALGNARARLMTMLNDREAA